MSEEIFQPMEESSWTGTKEAARWNDAYSRPLAELDMNSKQRDENDIEGAEKSESISTEQIQADQHEGDTEIAPSDDEMEAFINEAESGKDESDSNDVQISAADRAAIEKAQQLSPVRPRRSVKRTTYAPSCSPNGTEFSSKERAKKSKLEPEPASSSSKSKGKKRKTKTPTSSLVDPEDKPRKRAAQAKKANGSSQAEPIDLINSDEEEEQEAVSQTKQKRATKGRKKTIIPDDEAEQSNSTSITHSSQAVAAQNDLERTQEENPGQKSDVSEEKEKEKPRKSSNNKKNVEHQEDKPNSSDSGSAVTSEHSSRSTTGHSTKTVKKESQTLAPYSGKSLSSILGTSRFNGARPIGLTKRYSVPSLHLNRREPPKERQSVLIKLEIKKKKGQTNDCSDEEDANPFKRREGESEQEFLLRVCDEEGTYDMEKSRIHHKQDIDDTEEFIQNDNEDAYINRGEEEGDY